MLFFTLTTMEGHHFTLLENILYYTSSNRKWHEHSILGPRIVYTSCTTKIHINTRNYPLMNKRNVATIRNAAISLRTAEKYFVLCMHVIKFTQFFNWLRILKPYLFLFLPNANLNPDFQKYIAFGEVSKPRPRVLVIIDTQTTYVTFCSANTWRSAVGHRLCMTINYTMEKLRGNVERSRTVRGYPWLMMRTRSM